MMAEEITIRPEYSAVVAKNISVPSRATQAAIAAMKEANASKVVEIGCGLLANTVYILNAFPFVVLVDTQHQFMRIKNKITELSRTHVSLREFIDAEAFPQKEMQLDGAVVINILHILPTKDERLSLLAGSFRNLREGGLIFIDVPCNEAYYRNQVKTAQVYDDGHIMRRVGGYYTFYKNMPFNELKEYLEKVGFEFEKRIYLDHRVTVVYRKN